MFLSLLKVVIVATLIALLAATLLYLRSDMARAAAIAGATIAFWIIALMIASFVAGARWTRGAMQDGARLVLEAQRSNDEWDVRQTEAVTGVTRAVIGVMRDEMNRMPKIEKADPAGLLGDGTIEGSWYPKFEEE